VRKGFQQGNRFGPQWTMLSIVRCQRSAGKMLARRMRPLR
jgi:hypothetical protein